MATIYVYVMDTLADWELGYVTAELHSRRFFKKDAQCLSFQTVGISREPIRTMGGMTILPDCTVEEIAVHEKNMLLLPGADTWADPKHAAIIDIASEFLSKNAMVCAICGATVALANHGLLNHRPHTSNGPGFLEMMAPAYQGQSYYIDKPSVTDDRLITAGCTGALLWAKQIIAQLEVLQPDTLEAWYEYFRTAEPKHFFALMQSLPSEQGLATK